MSRIGLQPIDVTAAVTVEISGATVSVKGPKGELSYVMPEGITAVVEGTQAIVSRASESKKHKSFHGLARTLIANMIEGVEKEYKKELEIQGVGFKAAVKGEQIELTLGFAFPKYYTLPESVTAVVNNNTEVLLTGIDKQQVGLAAARIRSYYPAEPYKGKGIRYKGEQIRRKEGKTVA
ncbi:MAG: 50S ribosomal protein L6 [Kiritimatiellae bacterium]|jgi:large subunit ribosomal protein L6|nr:50S ribosomal protein L6 [Kiritimatiellia bacterium]